MTARDDAAEFRERLYARLRENSASMIPFQLSRSALVSNRIIDALLVREPGLSLARFVVLSTLDAEDGLSGTILAELTGQRLQSLGTIATALEDEGLIERRPGHGRERLHFLTSAGRATYARARQVLHPFIDGEFLGGFDAEARDRISADLEAILARLSEIEQR